MGGGSCRVGTNARVLGGGQLTLPRMGVGPSRRPSRALRRIRAVPFLCLAGRRGRGEGALLRLRLRRVWQYSSWSGAARGRAEGRGKGRYREKVAGKGEVPADNGAYVCLREWDGAAAAVAAATTGGRRCAAAAAAGPGPGPGPGPLGLRATWDRSPSPTPQLSPPPLLPWG